MKVLLFYTQILKSEVVEKDGKELKRYAYLKINFTPREGVLGWGNIK